MHPAIEKLSGKDRAQLRDLACGKMPPDVAAKDTLVAALRVLGEHVGDYDRTPRSTYVERVTAALGRDGSREALQAALATDGGAPPPIDQPPPPPPPIDGGINPHALAQLVAALRALGLGTPDEAAITAIVDRRIGDAAERIRDQLATATRRVTVTVRSGDSAREHDAGLQHAQFPDLLRACTARHNGQGLNILIVGPAGSGKTSACRAVADALGLPFAFNGAIDAEHKLLGFTDAMGRVVHRPFREIFTGGGVYLFDEIDASMPQALLALNAALANGLCDFPDGAAARHPDCVIVAAANTWGLGATHDYVGRNRLDGASRDRFVTIDWRIDESLERALAADSDWCAYVQQCRAIAQKKGLKVLITPRATYHGCALLSAGFGRKDVARMVLFNGLSAEQVAMFPQPE